MNELSKAVFIPSENFCSGRSLFMVVIRCQPIKFPAVMMNLRGKSQDKLPSRQVPLACFKGFVISSFLH